jgi:predicted RNase H-like nuclease (RuvC/YqgF family)
MSRKRYAKPTPQTTMNVSEAYEFLERFGSSRLREPKYQTLDRLIREYQSQRTSSVEEIEQLRESVQILMIENKDLRLGLLDARHKIRNYESRLGMLNEEDVLLQEKNEREVLIKHDSSIHV